MAKTGEKITWLTGYDYLTAKYEEKAGVDMISGGGFAGHGDARATTPPTR